MIPAYPWIGRKARSASRILDFFHGLQDSSKLDFIEEGDYLHDPCLSVDWTKSQIRFAYP